MRRCRPALRRLPPARSDVEFVARVAGVDDEYCLVVAIAEHEDGTVRPPTFQTALEDPDEQDIDLPQRDSGDRGVMVAEAAGQRLGRNRRSSHADTAITARAGQAVIAGADLPS